jgi:hypothetical protein
LRLGTLIVEDGRDGHDHLGPVSCTHPDKRRDDGGRRSASGVRQVAWTNRRMMLLLTLPCRLSVSTVVWLATHWMQKGERGGRGVVHGLAWPALHSIPPHLISPSPSPSPSATGCASGLVCSLVYYNMLTADQPIHQSSAKSSASSPLSSRKDHRPLHSSPVPSVSACSHGHRLGCYSSCHPSQAPSLAETTCERC